MTLTTLKMVPIVEGVMIPMVSEHLGPAGFEAKEVHIQSADTMLKELRRWTDALKPMRA